MESNGMKNGEQEKAPNGWAWFIGAAVLALAVLWANTGLPAVFATDRSDFGGQFGAASAFFAGLAFAGVVVAWRYQIAALELSKQANERQARLGALTALLSVAETRRVQLEGQLPSLIERVESHPLFLDNGSVRYPCVKSGVDSAITHKAFARESLRFGLDAINRDVTLIESLWKKCAKTPTENDPEPYKEFLRFVTFLKKVLCSIEKAEKEIADYTSELGLILGVVGMPEYIENSFSDE